MSENNHYSKVVDLKPRDKKSHSGSAQFEPNEELLESTARIKSQRDLILSRLEKMESSKERVSGAVYEKVHRDYALQLETIAEILSEKKAQLKDEIKKLYLSREKLSFEISRHKEVLEEAEFRHYLDEFTQTQYQEVENFETKEIEKLEVDLSHVAQWIRRHEDLFDPNDFGKTAPTTTAKTEVKSPKHAKPGPAIEETAKSTTSGEPTPEFSIPKTNEQTETTQKNGEPPVVPEEFEHLFLDDSHETAVSQPDKQESTQDNIEALLQDEEPVLPEPSSGDYYRQEHSSDQSFESAAELQHDEEESITVSKTASGIHTSAETKPKSGNLDASVTQIDPTRFDAAKTATSRQNTDEDSISEILDSIHLENAEESSPEIQLTPTEKPGASDYKLTVLQGNFDTREFHLKDNTSIGRSPSNDVVIQEPKVSRQHAAINKYNENYILIDLKSSNGVYVNGIKIDEVILNHGDEVAIGSAKFLFEKI